MTSSSQENQPSADGAGRPVAPPEAPEMRPRWEEETLGPLLGKRAERRPAFESESGREIPRVVSARDLAGQDYGTDLASPGAYPFTRGIRSRLSETGFWSTLNFSGSGLAEDANKVLRRLVSRGQTDIPLYFDAATLEGIGSGDPEAEGRTGLGGVAIDTLADMEALLGGVPLEQVRLRVPAGGAAVTLWAMILAVAERRGIAWDRIGGILEADDTGGAIPWPALLRITADAAAFAEREAPGWRELAIGACRVREAGGGASHEIAFAVCAGLACVEEMNSRGVVAEVFASRLSFVFDVQTDFFEEIAKMRAARSIWAREMRERWGPLDESAIQMRIHCQSAESSLSTRQPENNIVRVAWQVLAAALGGAESVYARALDEASGDPSEEAADIALRTQQVIAHESGVADTLDAFGGSYYLEWLTSRIEGEAMGHIRAARGSGGLCEDGAGEYFRREIEKSREHLERELASGGRVVVGENKYADEDSPPSSAFDAGEVARRQREKLAAACTGRDEDACRDALGRLRGVVAGGGNIMPLLLDCVRAFASAGEIGRVLREELALRE